MKIKNYVNYGMCIYESTVTGKDAFQLGDVVINDENEIGVIIQVHSPNEFRTDMFGNCSPSEIRLATDAKIEKYRPNIMNEGNFNHEPETDIIFRVGNTKTFDKAVFALFPHEIADSKGNVTYYQHLGQHSAADYAFCMASSRPAKESEYSSLKKEMEGLGYNIKLVKKQNRATYLTAYKNSNT